MIGTVIYFFLKPNAFVSLQIADIFNLSVEKNECNNLVLMFLKNHFCDMCWSYSLVFILSLLLKDYNFGIAISCTLNILMTIGIEYCQLENFISGTFDLGDIFLQILSGVFSAWIIKTKEKEVMTK